MNRFLLTLLLLLPFAAAAQDESPDDLLNQLDEPAATPVRATFNSSRLINLQTNETAGRNVLEFNIVHRFGNVGGGGEQLWGLDNSSDIRIGFDYGITDRVMVGIGRSKQNQRIDGLVKARLLQQTHGKGSPLSLTLYANMAFDPAKNFKTTVGGETFELYPKASSRLSYVTQLIIARKFHPRFSFALLPTFMHRNYVGSYADDYYYEAPTAAGQPGRYVVADNSSFALGMGARYRVSRTVTLTGDYMLPFSDYLNMQAPFGSPPTGSAAPTYYHPMGLGVELEVGGHVFQINASNSEAILVNNLLQRSPTTFDAGGWRLGFCIVRVFTPGHRIVKSKGEESTGSEPRLESESPAEPQKRGRLRSPRRTEH